MSEWSGVHAHVRTTTHPSTSVWCMACSQVTGMLTSHWHAHKSLACSQVTGMLTSHWWSTFIPSHALHSQLPDKTIHASHDATCVAMLAKLYYALSHGATPHHVCGATPYQVTSCIAMLCHDVPSHNSMLLVCLPTLTLAFPLTLVLVALLAGDDDGQ